jgi:hypothetical protein
MHFLVEVPTAASEERQPQLRTGQGLAAKGSLTPKTIFFDHCGNYSTQSWAGKERLFLTLGDDAEALSDNGQIFWQLRGRNGV